MSPARRIITYSIIRAALFAAPFIILMALGVWWWLSAVVAAIVAACISYLFLGKQRDGVAEVVQSWGRGDHRDADNDVENDALDDSEAEAAPPAKKSTARKR